MRSKFLRPQDVCAVAKRDTALNSIHQKTVQTMKDIDAICVENIYYTCKPTCNKICLLKPRRSLYPWTQFLWKITHLAAKIHKTLQILCTI